MEKRLFGQLELEILQHLKALKKATVREILEKLAGDNKYTTVMTVMNRMVEKELLSRTKVKMQYEYQLKCPQTTSQLTLLQKMKQLIFGGSTASMVSYLIESEELSEKELNEMEAVIQGLKKMRNPS